jgi:23S rRNA (cytidine1920-2'-O)/16S rRNA (cytidine1409-2'-O)-methyltransferase
MAARRRLDAELVRRGLARSRTQAQRLIADGLVVLGGSPATKPATMVDPATSLEVRTAQEQPFASRGGHKLAGALDRLGLEVAGRHALDAGAAHGGFTDVLLRRGAARVVAVDVAYGQLDWRLRADERVVVVERTNVRLLQPGDLPPPAPDLVVADLSFISLTLVLPALHAVTADITDHALMVKPQFEAGKDAVGKGGVVRDPAVWNAAVTRVVTAAGKLGLGLQGACPSPLPGPSGNIEFFVHLRPGAGRDPTAIITAAVEEGWALREGVEG